MMQIIRCLTHGSQVTAKPRLMMWIRLMFNSLRKGQTSSPPRCLKLEILYNKQMDFYSYIAILQSYECVPLVPGVPNFMSAFPVIISFYTVYIFKTFVWVYTLLRQFCKIFVKNFVQVLSLKLLELPIPIRFYLLSSTNDYIWLWNAMN